MKKFKETKSIAAHIERKNIDTDAIIPKQYLKAVTREGFGETLFDDWRYLEPGNLGDDHSQRKKNAEFWKKVMSEDIKAVEGMQNGRNSPVYNGGNFSPVMDNPTHQFHKWIARNLI